MPAQSYPFSQWLPRLCLFSIWVWWFIWVCEPLPFYPTGVDWTQYIMGAEYLWRWSPELVYPDWRHPLYSYLLGLGALDSYAQSARLLNVLGMAFGGAACIYVSQILRNPWLAVVTCTIWFFHPLLLDARDWINPYMLWGGVMLLSGACGWHMAKSNSKWTILATCVFGSVSLWLDGRTVWLLGFVGLWNVLHGQWCRTGLVSGGWILAVILENQILVRYEIELKSLIEQLELQRSFLFRDDLKFQLFPAPDNVDYLVKVCSGATPQITSLNWACARQMWVGNLQVWLDNGLLPPLWIVMVCIFGLGIFKKWRVLLLLILLLVPLGMSGLVWQPPRYLFWTLGGWVMCLGTAWFGFTTSNKFRWMMIPYVVGLVWWLWSAPMIDSVDQPKDWRTTGRLVSEQVGEVVLDCTGESFVLSQMSSRRPPAWSVLPQLDDCRRWMDDDSAKGWGVDTVLSNVLFKAPSGWEAVTGFDFQSGIVYMYQTDVSIRD